MNFNLIDMYGAVKHMKSVSKVELLISLIVIVNKIYIRKKLF